MERYFACGVPSSRAKPASLRTPARRVHASLFIHEAGSRIMTLGMAARILDA